MGNKTGSVRFTKENRKNLLDFVEAVLPTGRDEWSLVHHKYMVKHTKEVDDANKKILEKTGKKGVQKVVDRNCKSLKTLYQKMKGKKAPTGL